jgi:multiple sugar transport system substrate-binding protein
MSKRRTSSLTPTRRELLAGLVMGGAFTSGFALPRAAAAGPLTIVSHKVHQDVTRGPAANVEDAFVAGHGATPINWLTFGTPEVQDRIFREAVLGSTEINVGYVLPHWLYPEIAESFMALDALDAAKPLDRGSVFPGMLDAGVIGGNRLAVPVRGLVHTLLYNRRILEERGADVPTTIEQYVEVAKKCTYDGPNGKVYGHAANSSVAEIFNSFMAFARCFGPADIVDKDYKVVVASAENKKALELYKELADASAMPPEWPTYSSTDVIREGRQGRVALITGAPATYYLQFNADPSVSPEAGNWETVPMPPSEARKAEWSIGRHNVDFWSMVVPKNGPDPELSWEWISYMTQADVQTKMALNGNGPISPATFKAEEYRAKAPFADQALEALAVATPIWTPFRRISEGIDAFGEEVHACLFGRKSPADALGDAAARLERLL